MSLYSITPQYYCDSNYQFKENYIGKRAKIILQLVLKLNEEFTIPAEQMTQAWSLTHW